MVKPVNHYSQPIILNTPNNNTQDEFSTDLSAMLQAIAQGFEGNSGDDKSKIANQVKDITDEKGNRIGFPYGAKKCGDHYSHVSNGGGHSNHASFG